MAMLNMHQNILNQVAGNEQLQEEIQLTELLPVKQSRIRENGIFKGVDSDALKVLRSFTVSDCNDDQEQEFREENFSFECQGRQGCKQSRNKPRKENDKSKNITENADKQSDTFKKNRRGRQKNVARAKSMKKKMIDPIEKKGTNGRKETPRRETIESEKEFAYKTGEEESMYLDFGKVKEFSDEVYVYCRETLETKASLDSEQEENIRLSRKVEKILENDYSMSSDVGVLFDRTVPSQEDKIVEEETLVCKEIERNSGSSDSEDRLNQTYDNVQNESRINIEALVKANYLFAGENNNVVGSRGSKVDNICARSLELLDYASNESSSLNREVDGRKGSFNHEEADHKKYCCVVCEARFKGSGGLRNHYKIVHGAGPIFKCDECGKEFPLKERLKLHVRTHTGFKPYKCPECDKSFARGGQLVQHRRTHSQVKPYRCGLCSGTFTCAANLALHVKRHNGQKDHKCEICGRAFVRRDALKKHLECLHRDVKSFLCVICNKTFKGHLPQHMRTHARDRPHGCATCGQRFAQKSQLTVHQRTHSGQRPFRCLVCWQAFAHSTALKLHTRRHTGERPFKCAECNAGFTQLPHWKKHMKCIHGRNEPYACRKCKSFFRIKNDLECHEKTCHPELGNNTGTVAAVTTAVATTDAVGNNTDTISNDVVDNASVPLQPPLQSPSKYRVMTVERMRLLLAVLLKRISKQERLDELGFGKRLIDEVLHDSLISAGKDPVTSNGLSELETLTKNLEIFLKWTVPKEHWENFRRLNKSPEEILETLTAT